MEVELEKLVEWGLVSVKDAIRFAKAGYSKWFASEEFIQDATSLHATMQYPRTGEITEQEKKEWMDTLNELEKLNTDALKKQYKVKFLDREKYKPYPNTDDWQLDEIGWYKEDAD